MKKTLIALAAMSAAAAFAQSSVTISGQLDAGYAQTTGRDGVTVSAMNSGIHGASRLRFVGVEDMGGGSKANFWLEMQPNFVDGATNAKLFNRGAWAGLSGSWGEVRLGRQGTNTIGAICTIDQHGCYGGAFGGGILFSGNSGPGTSGAAWFAANPTRGTTFGSNTLVSSGATVATAGATGQASSTDADSTRYQRSIRYSLPAFAPGLSINATLAFGAPNATNGSNGGNTTGLDATYATGPMAAVFAYQKADAEKTAGAADNAGTLTTLGGTYDLSVVKLGLGYQKEAATGTTLFFSKASAIAVTAVFPLGAFSPYVKLGNRVYTDSVGSGTAKTANMLNLGTRYALSKRTNLYADYYVNNASTAINAYKPKQLSMGMQHNF